MTGIKDTSTRFAQQSVRSAFRVWLTTHNPEWSSATVTMHCSDAYYLYNNCCGITLEDALTTTDGLQRAYDAIERFYTENPTQTNDPSDSVRGYLCSLRLLKKFLDEHYPELINTNKSAVSPPAVPKAVINALKKNYASGLRFDATYINLLSNVSNTDDPKAERIESILTDICTAFTTSSKGKVDDRVNAVKNTGTIILGDYDIVKDIVRYIKKENFIQAFDLYVDRVNPQLSLLAKQIGDLSHGYCSAILDRCQETAGWLWKQADITREIDDMLCEYEIVALAKPLLNYTEFREYKSVFNALKTAVTETNHCSCAQRFIPYRCCSSCRTYSYRC